MKVLVTGANGFVGNNLCAALMQQCFTVRGAVRNCGSLLEENGICQVAVGDIGPETNWHKALAGVDCVVHLAARVHVMADTACDPLAEFRRVNRDGTMRLVRQAARSGVHRFIYLSSVKVNGEETIEKPFAADNKPNPLDPYGLSKAEAEDKLLELAGKTGMEVVIIRPPLVYGPGVKANFRKMMQVVDRGIPLPLGAIHNKRSLVFLDNLVDLIVTCIDHPAAVNQIFLASDGEDLSTSELLRRLGRALGSPARLLPIPQSGVIFALRLLGKGAIASRLCGSLQVDISKARNILGWHPPVTVDEGLRTTVEWYLRQ